MECWTAKFGAMPVGAWKRRSKETCPASAHRLLVFSWMEVPAIVCNHVSEQTTIIYGDWPGSKFNMSKNESDHFDLRFDGLKTCARYVFVSSMFLMVLCPSWHCNVATSCMVTPCLSLKGCWFNGLFLSAFVTHH